MNLASRCREAITQAATLKKELSLQKRKTAEAVAQTHQLIDQLKRFKQQSTQSTVAGTSTGSATEKGASPITSPKRNSVTKSDTESSSLSPPKIPVTTKRVGATTSEVATPPTNPPVPPLAVKKEIVDEPSEENDFLPSPIKSPHNIPIVTVAAAQEPSPLTVEKASSPKHVSGLENLDRFLTSASVGSPSCELDDLPKTEVNQQQQQNSLTVTTTAEEVDSSERKEGELVVAAAVAQETFKLLHNESPGPKITPVSRLVSSDDYETGTDANDTSCTSDDVDLKSPPSPVKRLQSQDSPLEPTTTIVEPVLEKLPCIDGKVVQAKGRSEDSAEDTRTTIEGVKLKKATVSVFAAMVNTEKESKDSWLEDYDEAAETTDTLMSLINTPIKQEYFPHSASPKITRRYQHASLNDSYDEEFPPDMIQQPILSLSRKAKIKSNNFKESVEEQEGSPEEGSALLSSIDAFEASFNTSFPDSFSPRDEVTSLTSPVTTTDKASTAVGIYDPFQASTPTKASPPERPSLTLSTDIDSSEALPIPTLSEDSIRRDAPEAARAWGSSIRERATASFQRTSRRGIVADPPGTDQTSPIASVEKTTPVSLSSRMYEAKSKADTDLSTRWLNEVKASTEKELATINANATLYSATAPSVSVSQRVEAAGTSSNNGSVASKSPSYQTTDSSPLSVASRYTKALSVSTDASKIMPLPYSSSPQVTTTLLDNVGVRQFPRTTPQAASYPLRAESTHGKFDTDRYSTPMTTAPQQFSFDEPERPQKVGHDAARSRYEKALALRKVGSGSGLNSDGRLRRSGLTITNEATTSSVATRTTIVDEERGVSPSGIVRERAARFASATNGGGVKPTWRTSSSSSSTMSSSPRLSEDDGDIPMRSSLSPRKTRTDEWNAPVQKSYSAPISEPLPSDILKIAALRSLRQRGLSQEMPGDNDSRGKIKAGVFDQDFAANDDDEVGITARLRDLGKQRRHINLSGVRQVRQADRGGGASPVRGITSREV